MPRLMLLRLTWFAGFVSAALCGCHTPSVLVPDPAVPFFALEQLPTLGDTYNHAASIATLPDGSLVVAWGAGQDELADDTRILMTRRPIGEAAWTPPSIIADSPGRPDANPALFLTQAGRLRLLYVSVFGGTFCLSTVRGRFSDDGGDNWSVEKPALPAVCTLVKNRPIRLHGTHWLLPAYIEGVYASHFYASIDDGATWLPWGAPLLTLPWNNLQPAVVQRTNGTLLALMRTSDGASFTFQGCSIDGATWALVARPDLPNPGSGLDLIRLSSGHLLAAYNDSTTMRTPLVLSLSADDGQTWSAAKTIASGPGQYSYPSLIESTDGTIHCVYSHNLEAIGHAALNRAWLEN